MFASIFRDLILRKKLDPYTQYQLFLQELPEKVVIEIFCWHNIDLENDNSFDFEDLLEKTLVIVRCKKIMVDFIQDKETDLVSNYPDSHEKVSITSNIVEPFTNLNPPNRFQTV